MSRFATDVTVAAVDGGRHPRDYCQVLLLLDEPAGTAVAQARATLSVAFARLAAGDVSRAA